MAKATKNENIENENVEIVNEVVKNEPSDKEKELQNQVDSLQADMKAMMEQMKAMMSMNTKSNEDKNTKEVRNTSVRKTLHQFDKYELITMVNMYDGGATLEADGCPSVRFNQFGDTHNVTYDELNKFVSKYKNHFEDLIFRILDERAVENLRLTKFYDKVAIDELEFEELFLNNDGNTFVNKVKTLPKNLQESAISLIIQKCVDGDRRYWDLNKFATINSAYGVDLNKCISMRTVVEE